MMLKKTINELWQAEKAVLIGQQYNDVEELVYRIFKQTPPSSVIDYYRVVPGGALCGWPLIGVNFCQPEYNLVAEFASYEPMISAGFWPILGDGFGKIYGCFTMAGDKFPVGFIDPLLDTIHPQHIAASSIINLIYAIVEYESNDLDESFVQLVDRFDVERKLLDASYKSLIF